MNIIILTQMRLFGDGIVACCQRFPELSVYSVLDNFASLRDTLGSTAIDLVLIDVTQGINFFEVRAIAKERPDVSLVACGIIEQEKEIVSCGRAGFAGYVRRDATADDLYHILSDILDGRFVCSAEVSGYLFRSLCRIDSVELEAPKVTTPLTRREREVSQLLAQGLANKEIARALSLSVATVKHHVHNILQKLQLRRRTQAIRRLRDTPRVASFCQPLINNEAWNDEEIACRDNISE